MANSVYQVGGGRDFVMFNDGDLSMEPVTARDLQPITVPMWAARPYASAAWSANCDWYFIRTADDIRLLNVATNTGFLCRKRSAMFVALFLDSRSDVRKKQL